MWIIELLVYILILLILLVWGIIVIRLLNIMKGDDDHFNLK